MSQAAEVSFKALSEAMMVDPSILEILQKVRPRPACPILVGEEHCDEVTFLHRITRVETSREQTFGGNNHGSVFCRRTCNAANAVHCLFDRSLNVMKLPQTRGGWLVGDQKKTGEAVDLYRSALY